MKILHYDCFSGISGDMNLGAMIDLGVDEAELKDGIHSLDISDAYSLTFSKETRKGIVGTRAFVKMENTHHHRTFSEIRSIINDSGLSSKIKDISLSIFTKIAYAEAHIHGTDIEKVHFHEVGALDSIIDIVGAAICYDIINPDIVISSPVEVGSGFVECAHGTYPVPAPATAEILKGIPIKKNVEHEATTPTGAAIVASLASEFREDVSYMTKRIGYGVGTRDTKLPNVLRVVLAENSSLESEVLAKIECNIDDMNPELYGYVTDKLYEAGALDVFLTPVYMKKGRPGTLITTLCETSDTKGIAEVLLSETTTLGIRISHSNRIKFPRETKTVYTKYGAIRIKMAIIDSQIIKAKPEYDDCILAARTYNVSVAKVYAESLKALGEIDE